MSKTTNGDSKNAKIVFGELIPRENSIEIPPKNARKKEIYTREMERMKEDFVEMVLNKNTRELIRKLEEQKGIEH